MTSSMKIVLLGVIILILVDASIFILSLFNLLTSAQANDSIAKASLAIVVATVAIGAVLAISKLGKN